MIDLDCIVYKDCAGKDVFSYTAGWLIDGRDDKKYIVKTGGVEDKQEARRIYERLVQAGYSARFLFFDDFIEGECYYKIITLTEKDVKAIDEKAEVFENKGEL